MYNGVSILLKSVPHAKSAAFGARVKAGIPYPIASVAAILLYVTTAKILSSSN